MSWGANVKYIFTHLGEARSRGIGVDIAMLLSANLKSGQILLGAVAQNAFEAELKWNSNHEDIIPVNFRFGFAYTHAKGIFSNLTVAFAVDTRYGLTQHIGLEYQLINFLSLRAGMHRREYTMGAGLKVKKYALDYAFTNEDLANSHQVSLNINF